MLLLFFPPLGAVAAVIATAIAPAPTFMTGGVSLTLTPASVSVSVPAVTTVQGAARYPAALPLLLVTTPPGFLSAQSVHVSLPTIRTLAGGTTVSVSSVVVTASAPGIGTIGSPGKYQAVVTFNGVDESNSLRWDTADIQLYPGSQASQCTFTVNGGGSFVPVKGMDIRLGLQSTFAQNLLFGGTIVDFEQSYDDRLANTVYHITCTGYTYRLGARYPRATFIAVSAQTVIQSLVSTYAPGFTANSIDSGVIATTVTINFDGTKDLLQCLTDLMNAIGGYWYVDAIKNVHAFLVPESNIVPDALNTGNTTAMVSPSFKYRIDLSQIRNRVNVQGGSGGSIPVAIPTGGISFFPISSALAFNLGGAGQALAQVPIVGTPGPMVSPTVISYTNAVQSSLETTVPQYISPPSTVVVGSSILSGGQLPAGATANYAFTTSTRNGETTLGGFISVFISGVGSNYRVQLNISASALAPFRANGAYQINVYRLPLTFFDTVYRSIGSVNLSATGLPSTFIDNTLDGSLGTPAPITNTASYSAVTGVVQFIGGSSVVCDPQANFVSPGIMTGGGCTFSYVSSGNSLNVTGFMPGSTYPTPGTVLVSSPGLLGVSGMANGPLPSGISVSAFAQVNDLASQATLASILGDGDPGIRETWITDSSATSQALLTARANAELTYFKNPIISFNYDTRDVNALPGRSVTVNIAGLSGSFMIQKVRITQIGTLINGSQFAPLLSVECSSVKFTLQDLLRQLGGLIAVNNVIIA
jgi:hypothetical protein